MGIPYFYTRIRPYGKRTIISKAGAESTQKVPAVIDGPSLAHFLFRSVAKEEDLTPFDYSKLGKATVSWLDNLRLFGFEIEGIYFDGALPDHKKHTRIDRIQTYVDKLQHFKSTHNTLKNSTQKFPVDKLDARLLSSSLFKALAPPPFLVFAVVEALFTSHYADRTWIVDGEADSYCAAAASEASKHSPDLGSIIFTNDSDLILYDCGDISTRVAMMNESEEREGEDGKVLDVLEFDPTDIATQGGKHCPSFYAFYMRDPKISFSQACSMITGKEMEIKEFPEFRNMYDASTTLPYLARMREDRGRGKGVLCLDSRVAEPIFRAQTLGHLNLEKPVKDTDDTIRRIRSTSTQLDLYLPVLFEDPSSASAWKIGQSTRVMAELLILNSCKAASSLREYRRNGGNVTCVEVERRSSDEIQKEIESLADTLRSHFSTSASLNSTNAWRLITMKLLVQELLDMGKTLPGVANVVDILAGEPISTWSLIHLSALFQAQYYSLRILKQVLQHEKQQGRLWEDGGVIEGLSGIAEFFGHEREGEAKVDRVQWEKLVKEFLTRDETVEEEPPKKRAKREKQVKKTERWTVNNMYGALNDMEETSD